MFRNGDKQKVVSLFGRQRLGGGGDGGSTGAGGSCGCASMAAIHNCCCVLGILVPSKINGGMLESNK